MAGILTGILLSRTISGFVAGAAGWPAVYAAAAVAAVVFAYLQRRSIPALEPRVQMAYPELIASVGRVVREERALRWTLATGFGLARRGLDGGDRERGGAQPGRPRGLGGGPPRRARRP